MTERRQAQFRLHIGDCVETLQHYPENYFDSIVTDPPYDLKGSSNGSTGFMGKKWDGTGVAFRPETWAAALRVLKPGGHLLAFGGTRTYHRMVCAIEDAGFEMRDMIAWLYGSGFPKSLDAGKALDAAAGIEREVTREATAELRSGDVIGFDQRGSDERERRDEPVSDAAKYWDGWGTALKPAIEPICVGRKPMRATLAANLLEHGTGAINIDGCRVAHDAGSAAWVEKWSGHEGHPKTEGWGNVGTAFGGSTNGRWPANVIHDGSECVLADFPDAPGQLAPIAYGSERRKTAGVYGEMSRGHRPGGFGNAGAEKGSPIPNGPMYEDQGSAARFFYTAKASMQDREQGLEDFPLTRRSDGRSSEHEVPNLRTSERRNHHPTVKPLDLMRYLVRLVTPKGGQVLDMFCGSGSTGKACMLEGFRFVGMDMTAEYEPIQRARITWAIRERYRLDPFGFDE